MLQQQFSKGVRLYGRLDRIYFIDLAEAPFSAYEHPQPRLAQHVDATEFEGDPRLVRELVAS